MKQMIVLTMLLGLFVLSGCATTAGSQQADIKRITPEELEKLVPPAVATYPLAEIVADTKQGKTSDDIIAKIKASQSRYDLSTSEVLALNKQGVAIQVLDYMQKSNALAKQNYLAEEINKAEKEKAEAIRRLRHERLFSRHRYYDPFWYSRYGGYYGRPIGHSHFGWRHRW